MENIIYFSMVTATISFTIAETKLFESLRNRIKKHNGFFGNLISCGYCLAQWIAFALVGIYRPRLFETWWLLDLFLTALIIAWIAAFQWLLMCWLMRKIGK